MTCRYDADTVSGEHVPVVRSVQPVIRRSVIAAVLAVVLGGLTTPAHAVPSGSKTVKNDFGAAISVTPVRDLASSGARVVVKGKGFDETTGIYVALCAMPAPGQRPGPCGGGVNMSGQDPASAWISSTPPPYGRTLAKPFRSGGRFTVRLTISPLIGDLDCRVVRCAVVTRADHLKPAERRSDVIVPVRFSP